MEITKVIKHIWGNSPETVLNNIIGKLSGLGNFDYSLDSVLKNRKHLDYFNLIDRWHRYWRVIEMYTTDISMNKFKFANSIVLEMGCGPLLGWGPMAIFLGSKKYYYIEPSLRREVVESNEIKNSYFLPFYDELVSNFGNRLKFETFYEKVMTEIAPLNIDENMSESLVDIILSNSVLEHIHENEIGSLMEQLYLISKTGGHYLHAVDFSDHQKNKDHFGFIYLKPKKENRMNSLNLMRKSEMIKLLIDAGFNCESVVYHKTEVDKKNIHPFWEKYSEEDLTSRVVFLLGMK